LAKIGYWFIMRISMLRERVVLQENKAQIIGATREQKVANITGGQVSGAKIKSSAGGTDIDVIGPNGELIMVGGQRKQMIW